MDIYATEDEQADAIKKWIKSNAPAIIIGIALGFGGLKGWDYWQLQQLKQNATASAEYEAQLLQMETTPIPELEAQLASYKTRNENKTYNNFLQLKLAKKAVETGDFDVASTALNSVIADAANEAIEHTAILRLARILLAKDKAQDALDILNRDAQSYKQLYAQVRGDAYLALGEVEKARQAYFMAKGEDVPASANLQMKIDNLALLAALPNTESKGVVADAEKIVDEVIEANVAEETEASITKKAKEKVAEEDK